jgi:oligoendopeptidase F
MLEDVAMRILLYRPENVALQVEETQLDTEYHKTYGATTVPFEGREHPISRMKVFYDDLDRHRREGAWRAAEERVARDRETYEALLDRLVGLRTRMARNAGCRDFVEYRFLQFRRPYTPEDCRRFHASVEKRVLPLVKTLQAERKAKLRLPSLRPWDMTVDVDGRPPLRPYRDEKELVSLVRRAFSKLDSEFGGRIGWMETSKLLDLDARAGKAPGGYMCQLDERRVPFIFMNSAGVQQDVNTMLHEGGHAFHCFEARDLEPSFNRSAPIEFAEVASMSMELLGLDVMEYGNEADVRRARREHLEGIVKILGWICTIDRFQLDLYARPDHTREERRTMWLDSFRRFRGDVDYSGLERSEADRWHLQPHLYGNALYYIEYAIAQLGALQVWRNFRRDPKTGVRAYRAGLALGNTKALPGLFEAAGARFDFGDRMLGELMDLVASELAKLR